MQHIEKVIFLSGGILILSLIWKAVSQIYCVYDTLIYNNVFKIQIVDIFLLLGISDSELLEFIWPLKCIARFIILWCSFYNHKSYSKAFCFFIIIICECLFMIMLILCFSIFVLLTILWPMRQDSIEASALLINPWPSETNWSHQSVSKQSYCFT